MQDDNEDLHQTGEEPAPPASSEEGGDPVMGTEERDIPGTCDATRTANAQAECVTGATAAPQNEYSRRPGETDEQWGTRLSNAYNKLNEDYVDRGFMGFGASTDPKYFTELGKMNEALGYDPSVGQNYFAYSQGVRPDVFYNPSAHGTAVPDASIGMSGTDVGERIGTFAGTNQNPALMIGADGTVYDVSQSMRNNGLNALAPEGSDPGRFLNSFYQESSRQYLADETRRNIEEKGIEGIPPEVWMMAMAGGVFMRPGGGRPPVNRPPTGQTQPRTNPQSTGEPVSVASGEYLETWHDFHIPGTFAFDGARYMGLKLGLPAGYESPLGACQISMFDEIFSNPAPGHLLFHADTGKRILFDRPFNFLPSVNAGYPGLELKAPWLKQLTLKSGTVTRHFRQYADGIYRLEKIDDLNGFELFLRRSPEGWLLRADGPDGLSLVFDNDADGRRLRIALLGIDGSQLELARYAYDGNGRMISADCTFGMSMRYAWQVDRDLLDSWHNRTRASHTHFTHDVDGRVVHTATNGIWNGDRFIYRNAETAYLPGGNEAAAQQFRYDENENVTEEVDALGGTVSHIYNRAGFLTATKDANGNQNRVTYDRRGNISAYADAEGRTTTYIWGDDDELHLVIDGAGNRKAYEHDTRSNVITEKDAEGHVTRLVRDSLGHVVETHFPDGAIERRSWDRYNRLESVTDAKGNTSRFEYDVFNRLIATTAPNGAVTRQVYRPGPSGFDTPSELVRADGVATVRSFDESGNLATVTDGEGRTWTYRYGAFGVLEAVIDPKGGCLRLNTDTEGRITSVTNAAGRIYSFERDAAGRIVLEEDFDGRVRRYKRDAAGQATEMVKPDGATIRYSYDKSGLFKRVESFDAHGESEDVTRFWYDARALLIRAENNAALVEFQRDRNGRVIGETLNGKRIRSGRDSMGNRILREIVGTGGTLVEYVRDPLGLIETMIAGQSETSFSHDSLGRETGRRLGGFRLDQRFDAASQLVAQVAGPQGESSLDLSRLGWNVPDTVGSGPRSARARAGQVRCTYEYDRAFAPVAIDHSLWGERRLTYDDNGQITDAQAAFGSERFRYDEARNLVGASSSIAKGTEEVTPYGKAFDDTFGSIMPAGKPHPWNTTAAGVVQIARGPRGERIHLTHDECGRVIERRVERDGFRPERWQYRWDVRDRLVGVTTPDGEEWLFRYDPFGRRVSKVRRFRGDEKERAARLYPALMGADGVPADTRPSDDLAGLTAEKSAIPIVGTAYLWDGDHMVAEAPLRLDGYVAWDEAVQWYFEEGSHRLLAKQLPSGEMLAVVCDHLGTPKQMFDRRGDLVWAADHHVWGTVRSTRRYGALASAAPAQDHDLEGAECPWRFPGQYADRETGLCYKRHRHYDPLTGQYASPDPLGLGGGDRPQGYVENPTVWTDPLGLLSQVQRNAIAGAARERTALERIRTGNPGAQIYTQRYLRDANGKIVRDPETGEGRRLDIVVVNNGTARSYEVTSQTAPKTAQLAKEERILDAGGNYIRIPGTKDLVPVDGLSQVMRLE